ISFSSLLPPPPRSTLFPYTTLFRSWLQVLKDLTHADSCALLLLRGTDLVPIAVLGLSPDTLGRRFPLAEHPRLQAIMGATGALRSEEHTSELQSRENLVCRLLLEKK